MCLPLDVSCEVSSAVNSWFSGLVSSAINPLIGVVGNDLLSTPQPGSFPAVTSMWGTSLSVADGLYVLLVLAAGIIVMGYQSVQASTSIKEIAPRLLAGIAAANLSLILITHATDLANGLASALSGQGADPQTAGQELASTLKNSLSTGGIFIILLGLVVVALALVLAITYVLRLMGMILLTAIAPLALASYALPQTAWLARWWWRALTALLSIQIAQAIVLTAAVKVFFAGNWASADIAQYLLHMILTICLFYILARIPFWVSRPALSGFGPSPARRAVRFAFTAAVLSRITPVLRGTSTPARSRARRS